MPPGKRDLQVPPRRPTGPKPPSRLFSLDSGKSLFSSRNTSDSSRLASEGSQAPNDNPQRTRTPSRTVSCFVRNNWWTDDPIVESPQPEHAPTEGLSLSPPSSSTPSTNSSRELLSERSDSLPTRTPSRHVVLANSPRPESPSSSVQIFNAIPIPSTPRPSRLARLGFRQVVDNAREAAIDDSRLVCWSSRHERDGTLGSVASTLYLPFLPNSSLTSIYTGDGPSTAPHSTFSSGRNMSPMLALHEVMLRYASRNSAYLPHENLPFYADQANQSLEDDRWAAIEAFEIAVKTWRLVSPEASIERCIWCCSAASTVTLMRTRVLSVLSSLLHPRAGPIEFHSPSAFISLVQALLVTLVSVQESQSGPDADIVADLIAQLRTGGCGSLAAYLADVEVDGSPAMLSGVSELELREALVSEAVVRCLENGPPLFRGQVVYRLIEKYWRRPAQLTAFEPLISLTHARKLGTLSRAMVTLVSGPEKEAEQHIDIMARVLESRVHGEVVLISAKRAAGVRKAIIHALLEMLCSDKLSEGSAERLSDILWKPAVEMAVQGMVKDGEWSISFRVVESVLNLPEEAHAQLSASVITCLQERIVLGPPANPCPPLTSILEKLSRLYPQIFFKPLFSCAATSKDLVVINHLELLSGLSTYMPDFWIHDPEMLLVALMNDVGGAKVSGKARLGQTAIVVELIACVKSLSSVDPTVLRSSSLLGSAAGFFSTLEMRLGVMLEAKCRNSAYQQEKTTSIPPSQRLLFVVLFTEIRLFTRSLRRSAWLTLSMAWLLESLTGASVGDDDLVDESAVHELQDTLDQLEALYISAHESLLVTHQRRSTMLFSPTDRSFSSDAKEQKSTLATQFAERAEFLKSLSRSLSQMVLRLLVVTSASLSAEDYGQLGPSLWKYCLYAVDPQTANPTTFLIMQCAEKSPTPLIEAVKSDMSSDDDHVRIGSIHRFNVLITLRFQLLSQPFLADRHRRRPFKVARDPLPFVATDIGSSLFVHVEEEKEEEGSMPLELRKRLAEVGWLDEKAPADQKREWIHTPLSLLPAYAVDRVVGVEGPAPSSMSIHGTKPRSNSDVSDAGLSRRSSDPSSRGVRRRAIFVPSFAALFPDLIALASDSNFAVACTARDSILDVIRADAALLIRPILDLVANDKMEAAATAIRGLLHLRNILPPATAHYIFNHLTGYLRFIARETSARAPFHDFALSVALLSNLVSQVSEMSIREIRRAKVEVFLVPPGSLWFPDTAPSGPMFPKALPHHEDDGSRLSFLTTITMIRVSQNWLFLSMLKKHPQDVQAIRKNMSRLELPSLNSATAWEPLTLEDVLPHKDHIHSDLSGLHSKIDTLSLLLSRSYLLLIAQIFSDRNELAVFIDGLNRILLSHGDDIGIVGQALIALMVASTRFRRLFTSGGGYPLFMLEGHEGIRQAIEYSASRFYALHQEAFIFQTLDVIAHAVTAPDCDSAWMMKHVLQLLSSLRYENSASTPDASGIRHSNKLQEKEALIVMTAELKPETFLASVRRKTSEMDEKTKLVIDLPEEYETKSLPSDDIVKLLLTHFLRLLLRTVLRDGIDAIGTIVMRPSSRSRNDLTDGGTFSKDAILINSLQALSKSPSDIMVMRVDFLHLVVEYLRFFDITKLLLRDLAHQEEYAKLFLNRTNRQTGKEAAAFLEIIAPVIMAYGSTANFAGIYEAIYNAISDNVLASDSRFSDVLVTQAYVTRCTGVVSLMARAVYLRGSDIVAEIEPRPPSYQFLTGIVLPLVLSLSSFGDSGDNRDPKHQEIRRRAWIRLLAYVLDACHASDQAPPSSSPERRKSQDKRRSSSSNKERLMGIVAALQILKIIAIKAEEDLSATLPGIWSRLASVLRSLLADGDASFAFQNADLSVPPSPAHSPHSSIASFDPFVGHNTLQPSVSFDFRRVPLTPGNPRMIDYLLWSLLELICLCRGPLRLQLRLLVHEKVRRLDEDIRRQQLGAGGRRVSSVFSKPRRRLSSVHPAVPSLASSPIFGLSPSPSPWSRRAGFERSPSSSPGGPFGHQGAGEGRGGPHIIHLGPAHPSESARRAASPDSTVRIALKGHTIKSSALVRETYKRIRLVQACMGYDLLLPWPAGMGADVLGGEEEGPGLDTIKAWTRRHAIGALVKECEELGDEFAESWREFMDDSVVVVDPDESMELVNV
ncbi:hypothetical protein BU15DRAFT_90452 [Melanogaster broomeanus]|nr:hypothetical protein BU15DRAFT_90452 [Melanogaster broomeanus]